MGGRWEGEAGKDRDREAVVLLEGKRDGLASETGCARPPCSRTDCYSPAQSIVQWSSPIVAFKRTRTSFRLHLRPRLILPRGTPPLLLTSISLIPHSTVSLSSLLSSTRQLLTVSHTIYPPHSFTNSVSPCSPPRPRLSPPVLAPLSLRTPDHLPWTLLRPLSTPHGHPHPHTSSRCPGSPSLNNKRPPLSLVRTRQISHSALRTSRALAPFYPTRSLHPPTTHLHQPPTLSNGLRRIET